MGFDRETKLVSDPAREERLAFGPYSRYAPMKGESGRS